MSKILKKGGPPGMIGFISRLRMLNIAGIFTAQGTSVSRFSPDTVLSDKYRGFMRPPKVLIT